MMLIHLISKLLTLKNPYKLILIGYLGRKLPLNALIRIIPPLNHICTIFKHHNIEQNHKNKGRKRIEKALIIEKSNLSIKSSQFSSMSRPSCSKLLHFHTLENTQNLLKNTWISHGPSC